MWTSRWPDHTRSRAASEALLALPPPPDQTDIFYKRFRKNKQTMTCFFSLSYERTTFASGTLAETQVWFSLHCWTVTGKKNPRALLCATLIVSSVMSVMSEMVLLAEHQHIAPHAHLLVFQVLNLSSVVTISLAVAEDLEPWHANGVNHWTAVGKELHVSHLKHSISYQHSYDFYLTAHRDAQENLWRKKYLQHTAIVSKAFELISDAHAKLLGTSFHWAANHQAVAWLKYVQRAGDGGEGHGTHKDGHFLV